MRCRVFSEARLVIIDLAWDVTTENDAGSLALHLAWCRGLWFFVSMAVQTCLFLHRQKNEQRKLMRCFMPRPQVIRMRRFRLSPSGRSGGSVVSVVMFETHGCGNLSLVVLSCLFAVYD